MHELSLACSMVEEVERILNAEQAEGVDAITLRIGELSGVDREALEFACPVAVEGTALEQAVIRLETVAARVHCQACHAESAPPLPQIVCAQCDSGEVEIIAGREFVIQSVELRLESEKNE